MNMINNIFISTTRTRIRLVMLFQNIPSALLSPNPPWRRENLNIRRLILNPCSFVYNSWVSPTTPYSKSANHKVKHMTHISTWKQNSSCTLFLNQSRFNCLQTRPPPLNTITQTKLTLHNNWRSLFMFFTFHPTFFYKKGDGNIVEK